MFIDIEGAAVKLLTVSDVLRRLTFQPFVQVSSVVDPGKLREFIIAMGIEMTSIALHRVREQDLGCQPRYGNGSALQNFNALKESRSQGQAARPCSRSRSDW